MDILPTIETCKNEEIENKIKDVKAMPINGDFSNLSPSWFIYIYNIFIKKFLILAIYCT